MVARALVQVPIVSLGSVISSDWKVLSRLVLSHILVPLSLYTISHNLIYQVK